MKHSRRTDSAEDNRHDYSGHDTHCKLYHKLLCGVAKSEHDTKFFSLPSDNLLHKGYDNDSGNDCCDTHQ